MGQIKFIGSIMMIALFVIALTTFAIKFGDDNNSNIRLGQDPEFAYINSSLSDNVDVFYTDVNTSTKAMHESTVSTDSEATEGGSAFKLTAGNVLNVAKTVMIIPYVKIFGSDENNFGIFLTAFISMLGLISFLYLYKSWRGNPD